MNRAYRSREGKWGASPLLRRTRCRGASGAACAASADPEALVLPATPGWGVSSDLALRLDLLVLRSLSFPCDETFLFALRKECKGVSGHFQKT